MQFFRQHIESMIEIDDEEWATIASLFTKVTYTKGAEVCSAGEIFTKLYYVSDGALRVYSISSEGKEITWMVNYQKEGYALDPFSADYVSYLTQTESIFFIETLCDTTLYMANFTALDKLYESSMKWMTLARKIAESQFVIIAQRGQMMKQLTAKEKYLLIQKIAPIYEEVLPDYQYASVLGITPQSLSRIKKEMKG